MASFGLLEKAVGQGLSASAVSAGDNVTHLTGVRISMVKSHLCWH